MKESLISKNVLTPTKLPRLKLGGDVVVIELNEEILGKGQELGYYLAQISISKSYKSKLIYGLLAGYTTLESLVGGLEIMIPNVKIKVGGHELPSLENLRKGTKGLINHLIDKIKSSTIDKIKNWLETKAKEYELRTRKHEVTYVVIIQACNSFGCTNKKVEFKGVRYD